MRHPLVTSGAWVDLRDVTDLRHRDRRLVRAAIAAHIVIDLDTGRPATPTGAAAVQVGDDMLEAAAAAIVSTWHIPYLPDARLPRIDVDVLGDLRPGDYDALIDFARPALAVLQGDDTPVTPDDHARSDSPSVPASG